jgi:hypothetical protein
MAPECNMAVISDAFHLKQRVTRRPLALSEVNLSALGPSESARVCFDLAAD